MVMERPLPTRRAMPVKSKVRKPRFRVTPLRMINDRFLVGLEVVIQLLLRGITRKLVLGEGDDQFCDVERDYALGVGDDSRAIGLQANLVSKHPDNALALRHVATPSSPVKAAFISLRRSSSIYCW